MHQLPSGRIRGEYRNYNVHHLSFGDLFLRVCRNVGEHLLDVLQW